MPVCNHPRCNHLVVVQGQCGDRQCPRNAMRSHPCAGAADLADEQAQAAVADDPFGTVSNEGDAVTLDYVRDRASRTVADSPPFGSSPYSTGRDGPSPYSHLTGRDGPSPYSYLTGRDSPPAPYGPASRRLDPSVDQFPTTEELERALLRTADGRMGQDNDGQLLFYVKRDEAITFEQTEQALTDVVPDGQLERLHGTGAYVFYTGLQEAKNGYTTPHDLQT